MFTIQKSALEEPEIHEKVVRGANGRKRLVRKKITHFPHIDEHIEDGTGGRALRRGRRVQGVRQVPAVRAHPHHEGLRALHGGRGPSGQGRVRTVALKRDQIHALGHGLTEGSAVTVEPVLGGQGDSNPVIHLLREANRERRRSIPNLFTPSHSKPCVGK